MTEAHVQQALPPTDRLFAVTTAAAAILDARTPEALRTILEITCERVLAIERFGFALYDAATDRIHVIGDPDAEPMALSGTMWEPALRETRSLPTEDQSGEWIVPILDGTRRLGAMRIAPRPGRMLGPTDVSLLDAVAALAASALLALHRLAAVRAAEHAVRQPQALRELVHGVTAAAAEAICFEEAAGVCLASLSALTGAAAGHAWLLAPFGEFVSTGVWQIRDLAVMGPLCARLSGRRFPPGTGLPGAVAAQPDVLRIHDASREPAWADLARVGARGIWAFPVRTGRVVTGVIALFWDRPIQRDRGLDDVAPRLARLLGDVIERDRRLAAARLHGRLLEAAGQAVIGSDAQHRLVVWNHAAETLFGWGREEVIGKLDSEVIRTRADAAQTAEITQRLAAGQPWDGEFLVTRRDGSAVPVLISAAAVYDEGGAPGGFVGIAVDLSRSRVAERRRRQSYAMDAVGRLAGAVAHDFNNLLTGIRGVTQLLLDDLPAESALRGDLEEIASSSDRAASLTARLLAFGRRQVLRPRVLDVATFIRTHEPDLHRAAGAERKLCIEIDPACGALRSDPAQLQRALVDLVAHAGTLSPPDGTITISAGAVHLDAAEGRVFGDLSAGDYITIEIRDSGAPLSVEAIENLFQPSVTGGAGLGPELGLCTAFGVIRQSDGTITVEADETRGTRLRVWLPRVNAAPDPASATDTVPTLQRGTASETLLLVEDEATVRNLARKVLVRHGYRVLEAADGTEAVEVFRRNMPDIDLVITDVIMPSMGGPELVRRLRAMRPHLRVLLMSGYTDDATLRRGFSSADDAFLEKPFVPDALARKVRALLDEDRAQNAPVSRRDAENE